MFIKIVYIVYGIIIFLLIFLILTQHGKGATTGMLTQNLHNQKNRHIFDNYSTNFKYIFFLIFIFFFITIFLNKFNFVENSKVKEKSETTEKTSIHIPAHTQTNEKKFENKPKVLPNIPK